jgi:mannose-1-phosphate guanylyltransferase
MRAFVLGAGLGKRLRPLTERLPKPLIPVWHRPLIAYAFDHLRSLGAAEFVVNTHHLPDAYPAAFPDGAYKGSPIQFRHEPILLETGGGLANVWDLLDDGNSFAVYNGDILSDVPLEAAWQQHLAQNNLVTLVLRAAGAVRNVAWDAATGLVTDLRNALGSQAKEQYQFTGIYFVNPEFYQFLRPGEIESVVEAFLRAIQAGKRIAGCVVEGDWWDLGDTPSYLAAHAAVRQSGFPSYQADGPRDILPVHPKAVLENPVTITGATSVGYEATVKSGAKLRDCIVWPRAIVPAGTEATAEVFI